MNTIVKNGSTTEKVNIYEIVTVTLFLCSEIFTEVLGMIGIPSILVYGLSMLLIGVYCLKNIRNFTVDIAFYYVAISYFLFKGIITNFEYIGEGRAYSIILNFYPAYLLFRMMDIKSIFKGFEIFSYLSLVYYLPQVFFLDIDEQYMEFAYWTMIPMCFVAYKYMTGKKVIDLIFLIVSIPCMLIFGCRGALVGFVAFVCYMLFVNKNIKHRYVLIGIFGIAAALILINLENILMFLYDNGFESRTIEKILEGNFVNINSRNSYYETSREMIQASGYGMLGTRPYFDPYPHSIYYELLLDFGSILGMVIFVYIMAVDLYELIFAKNEDYRLIIALMGIAGMVRLFVSSSLYHQIYMPALIALHMSLKHYNRRKTEEGDTDEDKVADC